MASERDGIELLQGTLDLIVLRALSTMGPQHAYGLAARLAQVSDHPLSLNQGTLYPALVRLEHKGWIKGAWGKTETNREAKFYALTKAGEKALTKEAEKWRRLAGLVDKLLLESNESGIEGALIEGERVIRHLREARGQTVCVLRPHRRQRAQDDQVQRSLKELDAGFFTSHSSGLYNAPLECQVD